MKIGMNMLLWTDHVSEQHYKIIETIKATGFDGIEVPIGAGDQLYYTSLGNHLRGMDLGVTAVTSLLEEHNIASPNPNTRQVGLDRLKWAIDMADAMGAKNICGPFHSAFAFFTRQPPSMDEKKWSAEMLHKAGEYAAQSNIILTPEALNRFECYLVNNMQDLRSLLEAVDHPNVRAIYDTHHANIEEKSQKEAIEIIEPFLEHVHISENDRGTPGRGQIDWDEVFTTLKKTGYDGWLTIEGFSRLIPEFANAINVWRDFSPIEEIYKEGIQLIKSKWAEA